MKDEKNVKATIGVTGIIMTMFLIVQKVFGLLRESILANYYGATSVIDSLSMSTSIATIALGVVYHMISPFTPIYADLVESGQKDEAKSYMDTVFTYIWIMGFAIIGIVLIFAEPVTHLIAPGFSDQVTHETINFLYADIWHRLFYAVCHLLLCYLHYHGRFIIPRACFLLISTVEIVMILLSVWVNRWFLGFSATVAYGLVLIGFLAAVRSRGYVPALRIRVTPHIKKTFFMVLPGLFTVSLSYINSVIDKNFASALPEGTISAFSYSGVLIESLYVLFSTSIVAVATPQISKFVARNDTESVCEVVRSSLTTQLLVMIPVAFGGAVLSKEIIALMYERGAFDATATYQTAVIFAISCAGLISRVFNVLLGHVRYSHKEVILPTIVGVVAILLNIFLNWVLIEPFGYVGLCIATLVSGLFQVPCNILMSMRYLNGFAVQRSVSALVKCMLSALIMCGSVISLRFLLPTPAGSGTVMKLAYLLIYVCFGAAVYAGFTWLMGIPEVRAIGCSVKDMLGKLTQKLRRGS